MKRTVLLLSLLLFAAPAHGQWQKIGKEQLPSNLGNTSAESLSTGSVRAADGSGLSLRDDGGNLGLFVKDGGAVGVGTDNPDFAFKVEGISLSGILAKFFSSAASVQTHHRIAVDCPSDEDSQISFMENASTKWSLGNDGGSDEFVIRKGAGAFGTNDYLSLDTNGNLFLMGDTVGRLAFEPTSNEFRFGSSNVLQIDADDGNTISSGSLDFAGAAEFGSSTVPMTLYQPAAAAETTDSVVHLPNEDSVHPLSAAQEVHLAFACPWTAPGTRIAAVKCIFYMGNNADRVNFAVKRQTSAAPGTTNDVIAFGGSDYGRVSDLTSISGNYYFKTGTANYTLAANEKLWAVVRLYSDAAPSSCRLVGIEWTFEQRKY